MLKFFRQYQEILAVMSEKEDGSMKILENSKLNEENRERFLKKLNINKDKVAMANQVHGGKTTEINYFNLKNNPESDALVTSEKDIYISIGIADCVPVFFYEPQNKIIGIAHAGWRGIMDDVVINTVEEIFKLGGNIKNIKVSLGPGINDCHFEVSEDVAKKFNNYKEFIIKKNNKIYINLKGVIEKQLNKIGVSSNNIENNNDCTFCDNNYFSYRRDKPEVVESMRAIIGIKKNLQTNK